MIYHSKQQRKSHKLNKTMSRFIANSDFIVSKGTEHELPGHMGSKNGKLNSAWVREWRIRSTSKEGQYGRLSCKSFTHGHTMPLALRAQLHQEAVQGGLHFPW